MKYRVQAFGPGGKLMKGYVSAPNDTEARKQLEVAGFGPVAQCDARPLLAGSGPQGVKLEPSEQFIREPVPRNVILRLDSGPEERRLIGHVEMLGGKEYVQLWTCIALYVFAALLFWSLSPAARELDLRAWFPIEDPTGGAVPMREFQQDDLRQWLYEGDERGTARIDSPFLKAAILGMANSTLSLLALMIVLALKQPIPRVGLTLLAVYAVQWIAFSSVPDIRGGPGAAMGFLADHPLQAGLAWSIPVLVMIAAERGLRHVLEMTVAVYEDPATGKLEVRDRGHRKA